MTSVQQFDDWHRDICACAHEMHMTSVQPFDDWHRDICACAHEMHSLQQFR